MELQDQQNEIINLNLQDSGLKSKCEIVKS